jgi:DNA-binding CsgD family transcriptional regulator
LCGERSKAANWVFCLALGAADEASRLCTNCETPSSPSESVLALHVMSAARVPPRACAASHVGFTPRQLEVLLLLTEGLSNPQIAERLSTTPKTVDHHVAAILTKLHARSRVAAVSIAHTAGPIPQSATPLPPHIRVQYRGMTSPNIGASSDVARASAPIYCLCLD